MNMLGGLGHGSLDAGHQFLKSFQGRNLRMVCFYLVGGSEQETGLAGFNHAQIVKTVAGCDGFKTCGLEGLDGCQLGVRYPHFEICDLAAF